MIFIIVVALASFASASPAEEFQEEYGMRINICVDQKISCEEPINSNCVSTAQSSLTSPFRILINTKKTKTKTQILGTLKSKRKYESYSKYIIEAREINKKTGAVGKRIGKFLNYNNTDGNMCFRTYTCNINQKQDVGMSCPDAKTSKHFEWVAPKGWTGEVQFIATVIKSSQKYWIVDSDVILIS